MIAAVFLCVKILEKTSPASDKRKQEITVFKSKECILFLVVRGHILPVVENVLNVVVVLQVVKEKSHLLHCVLIGDGDISRGDLVSFSGKHLVAQTFQRLSYGCNIVGRAGDLDNIFINVEIISACLKNVVHDLVLIAIFNFSNTKQTYWLHPEKSGALMPILNTDWERFGGQTKELPAEAALLRVDSVSGVKIELAPFGSILFEIK